MAYPSVNFKQLDATQAWEKIRQFCAYQERCHHEVDQRLRSFGMDDSEAGQLTSRLIEEGYLSEERFAMQYAGGHFRQKKWGKVKIMHGLKLKQVSAYCIRKAMEAIDPDEYDATLRKLASQKMTSLKTGKLVDKKFKCRQFLLQRGFEGALIDEFLKDFKSS